MNAFLNKIGSILLLAIILIFINGCTAVSSFPTIARPGDTVALMIGGSEKARKSTIEVILTDENSQQWNLQELGKVRSVFNLRADAKAEGMHYSSYLESFISWSEGHEPVQTVLVIDVPDGVANGTATLSINPYVDDDSSGISTPYNMQLDIIPGVGASDDFKRKDNTSGQLPVKFSKLEPAPYAKISLGSSGANTIGALSMVVDFDQTVVLPEDLNVYVPESNVRGSFTQTGSFGENQRMVYWHQDGDKLMIDVVAPQGIKAAFLMMYIVHPVDLSGNPNFTLLQTDAYDVNGSPLILNPLLEYYQ